MKNKLCEMTIIDHLDELRKRMIICFVFILIFSIITYTRSSQLIGLLKGPLGNISLIFITPVEGFITKLKVALSGGIVISSPIIFLQTMLFISPALYKKEKIILFLFLPFIIALFFGGIYFGFFFILPMTLKYLMSFGDIYMQPMLSAGKYFSFVILFVVALGLVFEMPIIMLILSKFGIINHKFLSKNRKYSLLVIVVITAVITPTPDALTLLSISLPLMFLFEISLILVYIFDKISKNRRSKLNE